MPPGTVMCGGVVSRTVTANEEEPVFPWASLAVQSTRVVPSGNVDPEDELQLAVTGPSTMSVAPAENGTVAPPGPVASAVMSEGTVSDGGVVSTTMTSKDLDAKSPWESTAVHITVVVPRGNIELEVGVHGAATEPSTKSDADAETPTVAPLGPVASAVIVPGSTRVGGVVSRTATSNEPVALLPCASVAVHRTATVPRGNVDPEAGVHDTGTGPSTMSVAEGAKATAAPDGPVASAIVSAGSVNTGGVVS